MSEPKRNRDQDVERPIGMHAASTESAALPPLKDSLLRRLGRWLTLDTLKSIVEIVAIVAAGSWALFEYGLKEREARLSGADMHRATLALSCTAGTLNDGNHWLLSRATISNPSKRVVHTFLVSWWYVYPPRPDKPDRSTPVTNDTRMYSLAPGESSEIQARKLVKASEEAVIVHVDVLFLDSANDLQCRIDTNQKIPPGGIQALIDQPLVCSGKPGVPGCVRRGCESQSAELLVAFEQAARDTHVGGK